MSLYQAMFGTCPAADILLRMLGTEQAKVPRFRDCYLDGERIAIHTRTGGGNREWYESRQCLVDHYGSEEDYQGPFNADLRKLPGFLYDEDDDFDSTYATFYYSWPAEYAADLKALHDQVGDYKPSESWQRLFAALKA